MGTRRANGEGTITHRADGRWHGRVAYEDPVTGERKRISVYGKTAKEARTKLAAARKRIEVGQPAHDAKVTVAEWLNTWRTSALEVSDRAATTKALYTSLSRKHLEQGPMSTITLDRLRPNDIETLLVYLRDDQKLAASSRRSVYAVLRQALDTAVRDGLLATNPATRVQRPRVERQEAVHISATDLTALLRATEASRYHRAIVLVAGTGLRRGEACALGWDDLDLTEGLLRVRGTVSRVGGRLVVAAPKTDRSRRTVPLSIELVAMLRAHRTTQNAERLRAGEHWVNTGRVFTTELGTVVDPRNLLRVVESAAKSAGLPDDVGVHTLRHSAAVAWLESGVHIKAVADLLGHSSIAITGDIYGHTTDQTARSAISGLSKALGL
ncbi:tyrosine-type recombinase/integrase [Gordonia sp. DT219]|uniref:tyrosine-type recombinase/integrase n=1 Tax=Gordonia sp. DT219 TaxID=3416658 RepID=UPI003CF04F18